MDRVSPRIIVIRFLFFLPLLVFALVVFFSGRIVESVGEGIAVMFLKYSLVLGPTLMLLFLPYTRLTPNIKFSTLRLFSFTAAFAILTIGYIFIF